MIQSALRWFTVALLLSWGLAIAQGEPSLNEVYATAQAGKLDKAQVMMQQVLIAHSSSAKAHFVQSELYARQGNVAKARDALTTAEKLAPGLPFAKPEAVAALQARLSSPPPANSAATSPSFTAAKAQTPQSSNSWLLPAALAAAVVAAGYFFFRKTSPVQNFNQPGIGSGLAGPQTFGSAVSPGAAVQQPYGMPAYGTQPYGQPASSGLGGKIMGGVATGLAVGAGVMAAEAIGRSLTGGHGSNTNNEYSSLASPQNAPDNFAMGGNDFGVIDASSWDDAASVDSGGGDWDS
jgi:hypothetical protein